MRKGRARGGLEGGREGEREGRREGGKKMLPVSTMQGKSNRKAEMGRKEGGSE
jgi:hypothetical protein